MGDELRGENLVHLNVRFSTETELKKIQDFLYEKSGQGVSFTGLVEAMANEVTIVTAVHNIKANKGSRTAGVDKMKMDKWKKLYPKRYNSMQVSLKVLCNLPDRHKGYDSKTFAVWVEGKWFGITYAFITHSHYEPKPFDQKMTPYTVEGRRRYVNYRAKHKSLPCDRPSVNSPNDIAMSAYAKGRMNFEYYMNREYAYSRDKGKCKCCGNAFSPMLQKHCHHVKNKLPLDRINKVPNLVWLCEPCHRMVHNSPIPPELDAKTVGKIMKYREKLKL